ncbi:MAG: AmpG family muropeptide MFS transporter [Barnesiella sp.]|nr:AmpG family muropeptide MFS transporter [Barnesiella sp.]MBD5249009.1 AmpG family muropeptide MFS transporter [Barnesiella sp.]MDE6080820.1 MFS transporter [Muribaculaceae bacterium]
MAKATKRNPWAWIPTLYFAQGIPFIFINMVTMVLFTQMGMSETDAALYTGWLYLPWVIKPFWGPIVDILRTKRWWTVTMQLCIAIGLGAIAFTLPNPNAEEIAAGMSTSAFQIALFFYVFTAFCSATHDIASDGFYMIALDTNQQSMFVGIRSTFYRCASVFGQGGLVMIAGTLQEYYPTAMAWKLTVAGCSVFFAVVFIWHFFILPYPVNDKAVGGKENKTVGGIIKEFGGSFVTFFKKKHVILAMLFMLLYRFPEAQVVKLCQPFLLAARDKGGLGMTAAQVGFAYGTLAIIGLTIGGIIGGICASRGGLKKWIWPMALATSLNCVAYIVLSNFQPDYNTVAGQFTVWSCLVLEQFAYGFGFTAFMLFMMYFAEGPYKTSHYAICTAFMALGMMLPGMAAGWIKQDLLGDSYINFFWWVLCCNAATWIVTGLVRRHINPEYGAKNYVEKKHEENLEKEI